jgi:hypothetical protein
LFSIAAKVTKPVTGQYRLLRRAIPACLHLQLGLVLIGHDGSLFLWCSVLWGPGVGRCGGHTRRWMGYSTGILVVTAYVIQSAMLSCPAYVIQDAMLAYRLALPCSAVQSFEDGSNQ